MARARDRRIEVNGELTPLLAPTGGTPPLVDKEDDLRDAIVRLSEGEGPVALDAERASGFRYANRDYLVQAHRRGAGTVLIDPIALPDLSELGAALAGEEWVLHAAAEDLPGLADLGMRPERLFDTELAGRLLGYRRTSLGTLVAELLGLRLAKEHSAADWSTRPLPNAWLDYAALDVEVLPDLRDALAIALDKAGKSEIAAQEFDAMRVVRTVVPRPDPWRRTSGSHQIRDARRLAVLRSLWNARDAVARKLDLAPGRVATDDTLIRATVAMPGTIGQLRRIKGLVRANTGTTLDYWMRAIDEGRQLPKSQLPPVRGPHRAGPPPTRLWKQRSEAAAKRLAQARDAIAEVSRKQSIPVDYLVTPAILRQILWEAPGDVDAAMNQAGARPWQRDLIAPLLTAAIAHHPNP
ncbi:MAG: HRDC domain-containing protein [Bifidobacteriaceae bacterium]|jgi:ribonuclease D|nr:HRDC domain-containing protein [Bifidobacteriaceae bacterium]